MIDINKKYRTRCGYPVRIYATDGQGLYPIHGAYFNDNEWNITEFASDGSFILGVEDGRDLVEIPPYDDFQIDDKVIVWNAAYDEKCKRYFAGVADNGKPMAWAGGQTSWTALITDLISWDFCEKFVEGE